MNAQRTACILALVLAIAGVVAVSTALAQGGGNPADIVISEVMFNAITETYPNNCGEWVEIYNKGQNPVSLLNWGIRDNNAVDIITSSMCPNPQCEIPPGGCWLIAWNQGYLQTEFNNYTTPLSPSVQTTATIFLGSSIGDGLANTSDWVALLFTTNEAVDCVSWASTTGTACSNLTYVSGGNGADTNLTDEANGQSITNIQGQWYYHQINGSPYNCINTAAGGSPTAVILSVFSARPWLRPGLILAGAVGAGMATLVLRRRGEKPQRPLRARAGP